MMKNQCRAKKDQDKEIASYVIYNIKNNIKVIFPFFYVKLQEFFFLLKNICKNYTK